MTQPGIPGVTKQEIIGLHEGLTKEIDEVETTD